jgi:hypothetical protein
MRIGAGLLALALLAPTASTAQTAGPGGIGMARGALTVGDEVLFVSDDPANATCSRSCSAIALLAAPDAVEGGLWTLAPTAGGMQWVYNDRPLFLWPEVGANFGVHYFAYPDMMAENYGLRPAQVRDPVGEGLAHSIDDPHIVERPTIQRRTLLAYNLREEGTGTVAVSTCIDRQGRSGVLSVMQLSGLSELDASALDFARVVPFVPAKTDTGEAVAVCGATISVVWSDASGSDPWGAQVAVTGSPP